MRLADTGRTEQHHVLGPLDERAARKLCNLLLVHGRLERVVELIKRLSHREARESLDRVGRTCVGGIGLCLEQHLGEAGEGPLLGRGFLCERAQKRGHVGQVQLL